MTKVAAARGQEAACGLVGSPRGNASLPRTPTRTCERVAKCVCISLRRVRTRLCSNHFTALVQHIGPRLDLDSNVVLDIYVNIDQNAVRRLK
jgi:hypothetical protein